jgi:hypothetical protein
LARSWHSPLTTRTTAPTQAQSLAFPAGTHLRFITAKAGVAAGYERREPRQGRNVSVQPISDSESQES